MTRKTQADVDGMIKRLAQKTGLDLVMDHAYGNQYRLKLSDGEGYTDIGPVYEGIGDFYYALYGMVSLLDIIWSRRND